MNGKKEIKMELKHCLRCRAPIYFIKMKSGRFMPVNEEILTIVTDDGRMETGRIPHWATCEFANEFRKK
jgi:hypothetical protein